MNNTDRTLIAETPHTMLTRELMTVGTPLRRRACWVVRMGRNTHDADTPRVRDPAFKGGCAIFYASSHADPEGAARACFEHAETEAAAAAGGDA